MRLYSINDLAHITGVSAHAIRAWEKRYNILNPGRTHNNCRYYRDDDIRLINILSFLTQHNQRISKLSKMQRSELEALATEIKAKHHKSCDFERLLHQAILDFNESVISKMVSDLFDRFGLEEAFHQVLLPFIDYYFQANFQQEFDSAHRGFINNVIRKQIITETSFLEMNTDPFAPCYLLFPQPSTKQYFGINIINHILICNKFRTIDLGYLTATKDIQNVIETKQVVGLITVCNETFSKQNLLQFIDQLHDVAKEIKILMVHKDVESLTKLPFNVRLFPNEFALSQYIIKINSEKKVLSH